MGSEKFEMIQDMECTIVIITEIQGNKDISETYFAMKKPSKYRSEDSETIKIKNGENVWVYNKNTGEVKTGDLSGVCESDFDYRSMLGNKILDKSEKEYVGDEKIEERDCFIVKLTPKQEDAVSQEQEQGQEQDRSRTGAGQEQGQEQRVWVDREFLYPLRIEMTEGIAHMTLEHRDLKFNSGLSDDIFKFES